MIKKILHIAFSVALLSILSMGRVVAQQGDGSQLLLTTLYYNMNQTYPNPEQRAVLDGLVVMMAADTTVRLTIISHTDNSGSMELNRHISQLRAQNVADYMSNRIFSSGKIDRSRLSTVSKMQDINAESENTARRVEIYRSVKSYSDSSSKEVVDSKIDEAVAEQRAVKSALEESMAEVNEEVIEDIIESAEVEESERIEPEVTKESVESESAVSESKEDRFTVKNFSLRTNMLYLCGGLINGGFEWRPGRGRMGIVMNGGYSPLASDSWKYNLGGYFGSAEIRIYMGAQRRGYLGLQGLMSGYNVKLSETGYQGDMYGAGVLGGYRTKISKGLDLDFTLAGGYSKFEYGSYKIIYNGMSLYEEYGVEKDAWVPLQVGVSLIWGRDRR